MEQTPSNKRGDFCSGGQVSVWWQVRSLGLLDLDQSTCEWCWHSVQKPCRSLSCLVKANATDSLSWKFSSCMDVNRVCHSEGLVMIGFFLLHMFHPLVKKYYLEICTFPWSDPSISGGDLAVSSHTTFVWDLTWSSSEWGELPQREALFSGHSPLCCLSQLSVPPGPGRAWMKGQSRLKLGRLVSGWIIRDLIGFMAGSSGPSLKGWCIETITFPSEMVWLSTFFNKNKTSCFLWSSPG